jgi:hypothetical protein
MDKGMPLKRRWLRLTGRAVLALSFAAIGASIGLGEHGPWWLVSWWVVLFGCGAWVVTGALETT